MLLAIAAFGCERIQTALIERAAARAVNAPDHREWLDDDALHVVLCGTGSPLPSAQRAGPCTAIPDDAGPHYQHHRDPVLLEERQPGVAQLLAAFADSGLEMLADAVGNKELGVRRPAIELLGFADVVLA